MTHYSEGKGLKGGLPDFDWNHGIIKLNPTSSRNDNNEPGWVAKIQWGDTWGDLAFGFGTSAQEALEEGIEKAKKDGCPPAWIE
jgi:hypothetical protein